MSKHKSHMSKTEKYSEEQTGAMCERIYRRYKSNPNSEDFITLDDLMQMLGITEDDLKNTNE